MSKTKPQCDQDRNASPRADWWRAGAFANGPAVFLWMVARLPGELVAMALAEPSAAVWINQLGDTVFMLGWLASAAWLWATRGHAVPPHRADRIPGPGPSATVRPNESVS